MKCIVCGKGYGGPGNPPPVGGISLCNRGEIYAELCGDCEKNDKFKGLYSYCQLCDDRKLGVFNFCSSCGEKTKHLIVITVKGKEECINKMYK